MTQTRRIPRWAFAVWGLLVIFVLSWPGPVAWTAGAAAILVTSSADTTADDGQCTLREAIIAANTNTSSGAAAGECAAGSSSVGGDNIFFAVGGPITLGSRLPDITSPISISSEGAGLITIEASACNPNTLPGGCTPAGYPVLTVAPTGWLLLEQMRLRHGRGDRGGGIDNRGGLVITHSEIVDNFAEVGGGVSSEGTLTVINSTFSSNSAESGGGGLNVWFGTAEIYNSTFSDNFAFQYRGGGISNFAASLLLVNSTISGNYAEAAGALAHFPKATTTIVNCTITGNRGADYADGIYASGDNLTLVRSLVAGNGDNQSNNEVFHDPGIGGAIHADAYNVLGHAGATAAGAFWDFVPGATDFNATSNGRNVPLGNILDPALVNNGGLTRTHALALGSPAQDNAPAADCQPLPTDGMDQREELRPQGPGCDAGSFEAPPLPRRSLAPLVVRP